LRSLKLILRNSGRCCFNILENAVKFGRPEGGIINIATKKEGGIAKFSISDNGIGIKEEIWGSSSRNSFS